MRVVKRCQESTGRMKKHRYSNEFKVTAVKLANASAKILHDGFRCIAGLTDGWALFLDAIIEVQENFSHQLRDNEKLLLKDMHDAVYEAVYRRKPKWWKFWTR